MLNVAQFLRRSGLGLEPVQPFPVEVVVSSPVAAGQARALMDELAESGQVVAVDDDVVAEWLDVLGTETRQWMVNEAEKLKKELVDNAAVAFFRERQRTVFGSADPAYLRDLADQMQVLDRLAVDPDTLDGEESAPGWVTEGRQVRLVALDCAPHLVPLYLFFGGFNRCPYPEEHAAVLRYWGRRFGARVTHLGRSAIDLELAEPPRLRRDLRRAVWGYFLYSGLELYKTGATLVDQVNDRVRQHWLCWWD